MTEERTTATGAEAALLADLLDRDAIRRVIEQYFVCIDRKTPAGMAHVFSDDAQISYFGGAIVRPAREVIAGGVPPFTWSAHALSNTSITLDGDRATADTCAVASLAFQGRDGKPGRLVVRGLQYLDGLVRGAAGWRIEIRQHIALWESQADLCEPSSAEALRGLGTPAD